MMTITEYAVTRGITTGAVRKRIKNSGGIIKVTKEGKNILIDEESISLLDEFYVKREERNVRILNVMIAKQSSTRSEGSVNYRMCIPAEWAKSMGITKEDPKIKVSFVDNRIVIEKE